MPSATTASRPPTRSARRCSPPSAPGGTKGAELQKRFAAPPFGWPKDAVNGALLTLLAAGNIRAAQDGKDLTGPKELPPTQIGKVTLYKEDEPPTVGQRLAVKGLLTAAGIAYEPGQEGAQIPALLQQLKDLAGRAGGAAAAARAARHRPPRRPARARRQPAVPGRRRRPRPPQRRPRAAGGRPSSSARSARPSGTSSQRLLRHADGLPVAASVAPAVAAIRDGRQLLDDPDPIAPLLDELDRRAPRRGLSDAPSELAGAQRAAVAELEAWDEWAKLDAGGPRRDHRRGQAASPVAPPDVATDAKLLDALDATPLSAWQDRISLVPSRRDQARQRAAKQLEPESVTRRPRRRRRIKTDRRPRRLPRRAARRRCSPTSTPTRP